jgi:hypothetical protein
MLKQLTYTESQTHPSDERLKELSEFESKETIKEKYQCDYIPSCGKCEKGLFVRIQTMKNRDRLRIGLCGGCRQEVTLAVVHNMYFESEGVGMRQRDYVEVPTVLSKERIRIVYEREYVSECGDCASGLELRFRFMCSGVVAVTGVCRGCQLHVFLGEFPKQTPAKVRR